MRIIILGAALLASAPCFAQTTDPAAKPPIGRSPPASRGWTLTLGVAPVLSPAWQGSRDMALSIFPDIRVNYDDTFFASVPDGIGWNALNSDGWKAGPLAKIRFGRDEDKGGSPFRVAGHSEALHGLGNISATAELGGFVEKQFGAQHQWRVRGEVRQGFGGHDGVVGDFSAGYRARMGRTIVNVGPRATLASSAFMQTYFGIDARQAQRSGLTQYRADGGLVSYGVGASLLQPLDRRSAVTVFTGLDRLADEPGHSPLIRERGRRTQFSIGIGYGYRFDL